MALSWEDFKKEQQKKFGRGPVEIKPEEIKEIEIVLPTPVARYDEPKPVAPVARLFNIHKRSLPPGIDKVVVFGVESKQEAEKIIDNTTDSRGRKLFAARSYIDDARDTKTLIFYDIVPADATPRERSIYFNSRPVLADEPAQIEFIG